MRNFIVGLLLVTMAGLCFAASFPNDGKIYPIGYGTKNATILQSVIDAVGTTERTIVLTGGAWDIDINMTIPTNVTLEVIAGSYLDVDNGVRIDMDCVVDAGIYKIFAGAGTATGSCSMLWRPTIWGDTNQFTIGDGIISVASAPGLATVLGTDDNGNMLQATNLSLVQAVTGDFSEVNADALNLTGSFTSLSNDMALSFMGYPKVTLTTNMVTLVELGSGTLPSIDSFTNVFDASRSTHCETGTVSTSTTYIQIDLGANYTGFLDYKCEIPSGANSATIVIEPFAVSSTNFISGGGYYPHGAVGRRLDVDAQTHVVEISSITPVNGRYISMGFWAGTGFTSKWKIYDLSFYGSTNGYRNTGGF